MNKEKTTELPDDTGVEIPVLASKPKKILIAILTGVFTVYLLLNIFWDKPKKETQKSKKDAITDVSFYPAPKIQDSHGQIGNMNSENLIHDNPSESRQEEKLLLLRQHAPIQMFLAESSGVVVQQNVNSAVDKQGVSYGSQINAQNGGVDTSKTDNTFSNKNDTNNNPSNEGNGQVIQLKHQDYLLLEGTIIPGTLQTALHSDLSGNLKALVSEDVYASRGRRVLIPKGSQLLGHYSGSASQQQSRLFVVWTRIIRPDGISIKLQAEGTDELGQAGLTGNVNHHYLARFGQASLLSLIGAGVAGSSLSTNENYTSFIANSFATTGKDSLQDSMHVKSTITVKAGQPVAVHVNQDISFYGKLK